MRIRTIKPEFWRSSDIAALSLEDRLLFIGLWSYVDDNGVGRDEPQLVQCDLFPLDPLTEGSVRVHGGLKRLSERGLITRFRGPDGQKYLQVNSWPEHQKINRPSKPRYPHYDAENCTLTEPSVSPHDTLIEDSPPEQGTGNREQGGTPPYLSPQGDAAADAATDDSGGGDAPPEPRPRASKPRSKSRRGTRLPDDWLPSPALTDWTRANCPDVASTEVARFRDYWAAQPGARGRKLDWDATWRNWARRAQEEARSRNRGGYRNQAQIMADMRAQAAAWDAAHDPPGTQGDALRLLAQPPPGHLRVIEGNPA